MKKCGGFGDCIYNTTAGCISPFNCPHKIEHGSITTATSSPLNSNVIYTDETYKDKEIARLTAENERLREEKTCRNLSENNPVDEFICSKCGFMTEEFCRLKIDEDDGEHYHYEYNIKYCPNCGAKVEEEQ